MTQRHKWRWSELEQTCPPPEPLPHLWSPAVPSLLPTSLPTNLPPTLALHFPNPWLSPSPAFLPVNSCCPFKAQLKYFLLLTPDLGPHRILGSPVHRCFGWSVSHASSAGFLTQGTPISPSCEDESQTLPRGPQGPAWSSPAANNPYFPSHPFPLTLYARLTGFPTVSPKQHTFPHPRAFAHEIPFTWQALP